jgi:hypothetical protein
MAYKIKKKGRPSTNYKIRSISGITPKGFIFHSISRKKKAIVYKRVQE